MGSHERIIVNADDLGASEIVNAATFDLISRGRVTSASIMANGPCFVEACRGAAELRDASFGVHLNVTSFEPLTADSGLGALVEDGCFDARRIRSVSPTFGVMRAVQAEWCAQLKRTLDHGVAVSHIDSHHHVHTVPWLFPVLKSVQRAFGIRRVRLTKNLYGPGERPSRRLLVAKHLWNGSLRAAYRTRTTAIFTELRSLVALGSGGVTRGQAIEVMVHPGDPDCQDETAVLEEDWMQSLFPRGRLMPYSDL